MTFVQAKLRSEEGTIASVGEGTKVKQSRQLKVRNNDATLMNHKLSGETATYTVFCCLNVLASTVGLVTA